MNQPRLFNRPARTPRDIVRERLAGFALRQRERDRRRLAKKTTLHLQAPARTQSSLEFFPPE